VARLSAVLFDLDDTLLDYSGRAEACWAETCASIGAAAGVDGETLTRAVREASHWFWSDPTRHRRERTDMLGAWRQIAERALRLGPVPPAPGGGERNGLALALAEDFARRRRQSWCLFPDAREALERLQRAGVPLGLVTNGDARMQRDKITTHALAGFFGVIVIEGEFGAGKPDQAVYRHALDALGATAAGTWMIGDNLDWDIEGAQRVGARAAWIDRPGRGLPVDSATRPDRIVRTLRDLADLTG
jgi:putative hydrolase of the HAD superfamily